MYFLIMLIIAILVSAIGWKKFVWFISLGYGFSVAALGISMFFLFTSNLTLITIVMSVLLFIYGVRLGGYLLIRELKSSSYKTTMKNDIKDGSTMSVGARIAVWLSCALLYVCEVSPIAFRLANGAKDDILGIVGCVIMFLGIALESIADFTKNSFKQKNPKRFCDVGVFKIVRCPNYLGEVLTWTGVLISGLSVMTGIWQYLAAICGFVSIVYIMFGGARRLEIRQNKNYGDDPEYQAYVKKVPILIPFIPLYSVEKYKWLVG